MESAMSSMTGVPKKIIRSRNSLEYMSKARSPRPDCSTTIGIAPDDPPKEELAARLFNKGVSRGDSPSEAIVDF